MSFDRVEWEEWEENYLTLNDSDWITSKCEVFIIFTLQDFTVRQMLLASRSVQWHHDALPKSELSYASCISSLGSFCSFLYSRLMMFDDSWFLIVFFLIFFFKLNQAHLKTVRASEKDDWLVSQWLHGWALTFDLTLAFVRSFRSSVHDARAHWRLPFKWMEVC